MIVPVRLKFALWNGKEEVGHITLSCGLVSHKIVIPFGPSPLKQIYGKRYETIEVPIILRCISDDGVDYVIRRSLDVRKKSKRQIEMLKSYSCGGMF